MKENLKNRIKQLPGNDNPFTTPEGYFDRFSERLMDKVNEESVADTKPKVSILRILRPALIMAASFAAIFFIILIPVHTIAPKLASNNNIKTEMIDLVAYYFINENEIIEALEYEETIEEYNDAALEEYLMASITEFDLVDYKN
ncbi:MAG: hypothetical protein PF436_03325 [Prolixibacteraceae bacterium]|jgi:hypothetical protein|nr:hypothetical protein [Prolixibacteraceae bacterium]